MTEDKEMPMEEVDNIGGEGTIEESGFDDSELLSEAKITKKLKESAKSLTKREVRHLVNVYYQLQKYRITSNNQMKIVEKEIAKGMEGARQNEFIGWAHKTTTQLENTIKKGLDIYSMEFEVGRWMRSITGIGPVLASGFIAHINMHYYNEKKGEVDGGINPAKIWRYAGLDPTSEWKKKQKRPWNPVLKVLCWKLGESFVKTQNSKGSYYGPLYVARRKYDNEKNARGEYKELAAKQLATKDYSRDSITKSAYLRGELSDGHLYSVSKRKVVKLFLSHLWEVWYKIEFGRIPVRPWIFAIGKHDEMHYIAPPNWPMKEPKE